MPEHTLVADDRGEHGLHVAGRQLRRRDAAQAATTSCFAVDQKYRKFPNLLIAYVWHLGDPTQAATYALTLDEAIQVATMMEYTKTKSWQTGVYRTTRPSRSLVEILERYRMTREKWWSKVCGLASS